MLAGKVLRCKLLLVDRPHGAAGIGDRSDLVGVKLLPPVQGRRDIQLYVDHPSPLGLFRAALGHVHQEHVILLADQVSDAAEPLALSHGELDLFFSEGVEMLVLRSPFAAAKIKKPAVRFLPAVHKVPRAADCRFPAEDFYVLDFDAHRSPPLLRVLCSA